MKNKEFGISCAHKAIEFMASSEDVLNVLFAQSGINPGEFRENLNNETFLAGILDFLFQHEAYLLDFCEYSGISPENVLLARKSLPGAEALWDG